MRAEMWPGSMRRSASGAGSSTSVAARASMLSASRTRAMRSGDGLVRRRWWSGRGARGGRGRRGSVTARSRSARSELERLEGDGVRRRYSNLGPLNCVPDLARVAPNADGCCDPAARRVHGDRPRLSVGDRALPTPRPFLARGGTFFARCRARRHEQAHDLDALLRPSRVLSSVSPRVRLAHFRGLCVFMPPPYLTWLRDRRPAGTRVCWNLDRRVAGWPGLRGIGDHFLIVMGSAEVRLQRACRAAVTAAGTPRARVCIPATTRSSRDSRHGSRAGRLPRREGRDEPLAVRARDHAVEPASRTSTGACTRGAFVSESDLAASSHDTGTNGS